MIVLVGCGVPVLGNTQQRERQPPKLLSFKRLNLSQFVIGDVNPVQPNQWELSDILCQLVQNIRPLDKRDGRVTLQHKGVKQSPNLLFAVLVRIVVSRNTVKRLHGFLTKLVVVQHSLRPVIFVKNNAH